MMRIEKTCIRVHVKKSCFRGPPTKPGRHAVRKAPALAGLSNRSLFSVPKDEARRDLWENHLRRSEKPLDDTCAVCALLLEERCVLRDNVHVVGRKEAFLAPAGSLDISMSELGTVLGTAADGVISCVTCAGFFGSWSQLEDHRRRMHKHECSYCPYSSNIRSHVVLHERTHTGERPFRCQSCGKAFAQKSQLTVHQAIHAGVKRFKCHVCGMEFIHKRSFTRHRGVHFGRMPKK